MAALCAPALAGTALRPLSSAAPKSAAATRALRRSAASAVAARAPARSAAALRAASSYSHALRVSRRRASRTPQRALPDAAVTASLVAAGDTWTMWAVLLSVSAFGIWSERSTSWGAALSGPLVTTLAALALSNAGVLPTAAPAYGVVTGFLLPLAVPLLLFGANLRRVVRDTGRLLGAFTLGAIGTVGGTLLALAVFPMGHLGADAWKMAAALCSRHIGGAVNYVAVSEYLAITPSLVTAGLAADNLICALYFTGVFALAAGVTVQQRAGDAAAAAEADAPAGDAAEGLTVTSAAYALAASACICAASVAGAHALRISGADIPLITAAVVALATLFPRRLGALAPAGNVIAALLLQVFFAVVGAAGSVRAVLATAPALFLFSALQVAVHLGFVLAAGKAAGYGRAELLLASNACVGGPTTAAGMATSKGWRTLVVPAILMGVLGYACATFASIALGVQVLKPLWGRLVLRV